MATGDGVADGLIVGTVVGVGVAVGSSVAAAVGAGEAVGSKVGVDWEAQAMETTKMTTGTPANKTRVLIVQAARAISCRARNMWLITEVNCNLILLAQT